MVYINVKFLYCSRSVLLILSYYDGQQMDYPGLSCMAVSCPGIRLTFFYHWTKLSSMSDYFGDYIHFFFIRYCLNFNLTRPAPAPPATIFFSVVIPYQVIIVVPVGKPVWRCHHAIAGVVDASRHHLCCGCIVTVACTNHF